jgi:hypothetical protein
MIRRALLALLVAAPAGMARAQDMFTLKPIVKAVREGDDEKVRQALLRGQSQPERFQRTALLMIAVMDGRSPWSDALKGGAVADAPTRQLHLADSCCRAWRRRHCRLLLKRNAKPSVQTRQGVTPLMVAARLGHAEIVRLLLERKADPNVPDFTGRTALTYARQGNRTTIEAMLRKAGGRE